MKLRDAIEGFENEKRYSNKAPDWRKIIRAIDSIRFSPNAGGQLAMKFILISDKKIISKVAMQTQQPFVGEVKYLVVAVSDDSKLVRLYDERGVRYSSLQAGASIQNFLLSLTEHGLSTYWVRHFYDEKIKTILKIPEKMIVDGIFPIGVSLKSKQKNKVISNLDGVLYFDEWKNNTMVPETKLTVESS